MIAFSGIAVFVFGNKIDPQTGNPILADGVRKEFDIALSQGVIPIPVGLTGSMAEELWRQVDQDFDSFFSGFGEVKEMFQSLNDPGKTLKECIQIIVKMATIISKK
jgi:hypothetical protein